MMMVMVMVTMAMSCSEEHSLGFSFLSPRGTYLYYRRDESINQLPMDD